MTLFSATIPAGASQAAHWECGHVNEWAAGGNWSSPLSYRADRQRHPQGWAIECDGKLSRSGHRLEVLAAWLDAILAGASEYDADDIAEVIARRPRPSYEERMAVFKPPGRPEHPKPLGRKAGCNATHVLEEYRITWISIRRRHH